MQNIIRAFIANNNPPSKKVVEEGLKYNETWSYYPDDHPRRSLYAGDTRAALVPFLAHRHFGETYRWLLYMDDDTVFIPPAVQRLLARFDSEMPYFLTDHFWYMDKKGQGIHPNRQAPRCLPCGYNVAVHGGAKPAFPAPIGCV
ncbi:hypothetical protein H632_c2477p0 [Helicosporidium sp. ATCC 50920]|nr:hypothetical protein H632_c2477p0 [Helicosporidium sp. ATCC 50920]|eukprot:KDD73155.1 hypothetical protein H632_c2477p0 [Helicosporidium sp. ATCC 50920]